MGFNLCKRQYQLRPAPFSEEHGFFVKLVFRPPTLLKDLHQYVFIFSYIEVRHRHKLPITHLLRDNADPREIVY